MAEGHAKTAPLPIVNAEEMIIPMMAGRNPLNIAVISADFWMIFLYRIIHVNPIVALSNEIVNQ